MLTSHQVLAVKIPAKAAAKGWQKTLVNVDLHCQLPIID